jgi:predicted ribosomally synthesized peptide with SipW-like signal peptide
MTTTTLERRRGPATKIIGSVAILAFAGALFLIASLALFTDQATTTDNVFSTGTIDIAASPATAAVTMPAMAPGDEVTAPMLLANNGTLELRYSALSTTTEDALAAQLVLSIREGVTPANCTDANWDASGTQIYSGVLGTIAGTPLFGSNAQGSQPGDRVLAAGASENLCVNVTLPLSASGIEGLSTTATFTFDAEQTVNNP